MKLHDDRKLVNRQILLSLLILIFSIFGIVILALNIDTANGSNHYGSTTEQTFKAIGIVLATYIVLCMGFFIFTGVQQKRNHEYIYANLNFASVLIVPAIFNLMFSFYESSLRDFGNYVKSWFEPTNLTMFNPDFQRGQSTRIITFIFWLFDLQWLAMMLINLFDPHNSKGAWLDSFHYFTVQANIMVFFYLWAKWLMPSWKLFNSNALLILVVTYIVIVALGYNAVLLPNSISNGDTKSWTGTDWYLEILQHMIVPLLFLIYGIYIFRLSIYTKEFKLIRCIGYGIVYPTMYLIYALFLPFVSDISVYGKFSNINIDNGGAYTAYGFIFGFWILFIVFIALFWSLNHLTIHRAQQGYMNRNKEIRANKY